MKRLMDAVTIMAVGVTVLLPVRAHALTTLYGYNDDGHQYIGRVNHGGTTSQWLCDDGPSASDAVWTNLGNSSSLTDDYVIHADASSGAGGDDFMEIIRSNKTITGDCAATSGQWEPLNYGVYYLDIHGDSGDELDVRGGAGNTYAYGDSGADYVTQFSGVGRAYGGAGADNLFGNAGSGDELRAEAGDDCIQDANNSWEVYDCGGDRDRWYHTNTGEGQPAKVSCEDREDWCCGFC